MWELTVPWEEHIEEAYERKKKWRITGQCRSNGWKASRLPVELGAKSLTARLLGKALLDIGVIGDTKSRAIKLISDTAERIANGYG